MEANKLRIALAGNPNAGKTTIFNALTGARQHVGNWPGKTVEQKIGRFNYKGHEIEIVDLPGTYSLSAYSPEEIIARDYLLHQRPDLVLIVVDAANLERNLYLAVQVLELEIPAIVVLNMMDMAGKRGLTIDVESLSLALQAPVVPVVARKEKGINTLKDTLINMTSEAPIYASS